MTRAQDTTSDSLDVSSPSHPPEQGDDGLLLRTPRLFTARRINRPAESCLASINTKSSSIKDSSSPRETPTSWIAVARRNSAAAPARSLETRSSPGSRRSDTAVNTSTSPAPKTTTTTTTTTAVKMSNSSRSADSPSKGILSGWFTGRATTTGSAPPPTTMVPADRDDELLNLDLDAVLLPPGMSSSGRRAGDEAFSQAAFERLEMVAMELLGRLQIAYRQRTAELRDVQARRAEQMVEADELGRRNRLLKTQLEIVAREAAQQETTMRQLAGELSLERRLRAEERTARDKSVLLPRDLSAETMSISEDLGFDEEARRRRWRKSGVTVRSARSLDTDEESIDEASIFSRPRSPTLGSGVHEASSGSSNNSNNNTSSNSSNSTTAVTTNTPPTPLTPITPLDENTFASSRIVSLDPSPPPPLPPPSKSQPSPRPTAAAPMTTFQKLLKGISGEAARGEGGLRPGLARCRNCQGQDASMAWDTVGLLQDENRGLKVRVEELEAGVDRALGVIVSVGL